MATLNPNSSPEDPQTLIVENNIQLTYSPISEKPEDDPLFLYQDSENSNNREKNIVIIDETEDDVGKDDWVLGWKNSSDGQFFKSCNVKEDMGMNIGEGCKNNVEKGDFGFDGRNLIGNCFSQERCNMNQDMVMDANEEDERSIEEDDEGVNEEEDKGDDDKEEDQQFNLPMGSDSYEGNLFQAIDMNKVLYNVRGQYDDQSNMGYISPRAERYSSFGGPSFFGNGMKRGVSHDYDLLQDQLEAGSKRLRTDGSSSDFHFDLSMELIQLSVGQARDTFFGNGMKRGVSHDYDLLQDQLGAGSKRLRTDVSSSEIDFDLSMEQIQLCVGKARDMYDGKKKDVEELLRNQQILISEVQQKDNVIQHLQKDKYEELQKKDVQINRLERELFVMGNLVQGYRDDLKATDKKFSEYRERCQLPEEPIYKDVGPGGIVLSTMEIERLRLKKEEEDRVKRVILEETVKQFEVGCVDILKGYFDRIEMMDTKLMALEKEAIQMKEVSANCKIQGLGNY